MGKMKERDIELEHCFELASREINALVDAKIENFRAQGQQVDIAAHRLYTERQWILARLKYLELKEAGVDVSKIDTVLEAKEKLKEEGEEDVKEEDEESSEEVPAAARGNGGRRSRTRSSARAN